MTPRPPLLSRPLDQCSAEELSQAAAAIQAEQDRRYRKRGGPAGAKNRTDTRERRAIEQIDCPTCGALKGQPCPNAIRYCCAARRAANQARTRNAADH